MGINSSMIPVNSCPDLSSKFISLSENTNYLGINHSNESWNPENLLILLELLDSISRWNDEFKSNHLILGHTVM